MPDLASILWGVAKTGARQRATRRTLWLYQNQLEGLLEDFGQRATLRTRWLYQNQRKALLENLGQRATLQTR